jgi:UDPglucose 6-dehydrogenase
VTGAAWTATGHRVLAWDPDPTLRNAAASGRCPVVEPGVDAALASAVEQGTLEVVDEAETAVGRAMVTHLAFDTRLDESSRVDDPRLDSAVETFAAAAPSDALLLVSSQVPIGTCRRWRERIAAEGRDLLIAHVPENLRLGTALDDLLRPARLIIGADDDDAFERAAKLLGFVEADPIRTRLASAEMAKHATNAYLALCIAFANDLAWLALHADADPAEVVAALRADPRVSPSAPLGPGTAFSGETLIRDLTVLRILGEQYGRPDLFAAIISANERHGAVAVEWLEEALGSLEGRQLAVAGLTYKPGTSTLRDSLPLRVIRELLDRGATVRAWDPAAEPVDPTSGLERADSLAECVEGADALAVLTKLAELEKVEWEALRPRRRLVIDACMGVDRADAEAAGWTYRGFSATTGGA